jgi:F420H(2)-dependent quinone reductase
MSDPKTGSHGPTFLERAASALVASPAGAWFYLNVAPGLDRALIKFSRGRLATAGPGRVGLLRVRGAKSGAERHTPLVYTRDGENVLLVASRGGDLKHPAWYHNLKANPDVWFRIRGEERPYRARTSTAEERPRVWRLVNRTYPGYEVYQRRAGSREIPVVVLEPRGNGHLKG